MTLMVRGVRVRGIRTFSCVARCGGLRTSAPSIPILIPSRARAISTSTSNTQFQLLRTQAQSQFQIYSTATRKLSTSISPSQTSGPAQPRAGSESPVQPQSTTGGTTGTGTGTDPPPKLPAKFLVYYAGKRTLPLALIKLSTLFLFTTGILLVSISVAGGALTSPSPSSSSSADDGEESTSEPTPPTPLIALSTPTSLLLFLAFSTLPFLFLNHISPPYTTHIYLHLPPWARASPSHLASYIRKLPPSAQLDIVTMAWSGRPRISGGVRLGELEWLGEGQTRKFGCGNMVWRDTLGAGKDRGKGRERGLFYVDPSGRLARTPLGGEVRAGEGVVARVRELTREREVGTQQGGKGV